MYPDNKYKDLKMKYGYILSSQISDIIESPIVEEKLEEFLWFYGKTPEEFCIELITDDIDRLLAPSKDTILHQFIRDVFNLSVDFDVYYFKDNYYNEDSEFQEKAIYENFVQQLEYYGVKIPEFPNNVRQINKDFDDEVITKEEFDSMLSLIIDGLARKFSEIEENIKNEVFYLLFNDKLLLLKFNLFLSKILRKIDYTKYPHVFDVSHNIKRCNYLPEWLKKAVYFRDNGSCQDCGKDLSSTIRICDDKEKQYDHIIPLELGGSNDPTNFQLLCSTCNLSKLGSVKIPKYYYQLYW